MGKVVERKKKKKGRPSLLDLQKRRIKEQAELEQQQNQKSRSHNPNFNTPITSRRSTRRNPPPDPSDDDEDQSARNRSQKKLERGSSRRGNTDLDGEEDVDTEEEDDGDARSLKKRKINAIPDGSGSAEIHKAEKLVSGGNNSIAHQGTVADDGNGTLLPDKKLLVFILDRLEKKDTYGVFSEPVDPEELPDYHEVIKHPMDFSTVRKKLDGGEYANLEEFENDVFLICSNAMMYNAPDTVYFRQAKSIHELAEKSFDNLRRDSDADDDEQEPKRRGRPPTKHLKKPVGRPPLDRTGSDNASGATLATGRENPMWSNYDLRKCSPMEKVGSRDSAGRLHLNSGNNEVYNSGWLSQQKLDRNDDFTGSQLRGGCYKQGKKPVAASENRRDTHKQFHPSLAVNNTSVFSTFDVEKKMLLPVGLHAEYGYARSLARFAAGLGPLAWGIASMKIEKSLPSEVKFGPGWVGYDDVTTQRSVLINLRSSDQAGASDPFSPPSVAAHSALKTHGDKSTYQQEEEDNSLGYQLASTVAALACQPAAAAAAISIPTRPPPHETAASHSSEVKNGLPPEGQTHLPQSSIAGAGQKPSFQFQRQAPRMHLGMNHPVNMQLKMMNQLRAPTGLSHNYPQMGSSLGSRSSTDAVPGTSSSASDVTNLFLTNRGTTNSMTSSSIQASDLAAGAARLRFHPESTSESVPPDLNIQFQSPGSPSSSRMDSKHPDLALQL